MANPEHVRVVGEGAEAVRQWRIANPGIRLDLSDAYLGGADLRNADLRKAGLRCAIMGAASLSSADLSNADLKGASLCTADLSSANLSGANLSNADLSGTYLGDADLSNADLSQADLSGANLGDANLSDALLPYANLCGAYLSGALFLRTHCHGTVFAGVDLAQAQDLDTIRHGGPSEISISTLDLSKGAIPAAFLRGCGLAPWQVLESRLHDPALSPADIAEIQQQMFDERTKGYFLSGIFISYCHDDSAFVEKVYARLQKEGANVWLDNRHAVAGPIEKQVERAIRVNDVVLLVLSRSSVESDWVEAELEWAREKEKREGRDVLCPVALDGAWKEKVRGSVLWRKVKDKNILDFSEWETDAFETGFRKLLDGLKIWYGSQA